MEHYGRKALQKYEEDADSSSIGGVSLQYKGKPLIQSDYNQFTTGR